MGGLCMAGVKRQTNRDENGGGECQCNRGDDYHGHEKKDHWHEKTQFYLICWNFGSKRGWSTREHLTAVIYELITALQLTSQLLYLFTHLSITGTFSLPAFGFIASSHFYFCNRVWSSGAISGAALWLNALKCCDSPQNTTKQNSPLPNSEIISCFFLRYHIIHVLFIYTPFSRIQQALSHMIRYLFSGGGSWLAAGAACAVSCSSGILAKSSCSATPMAKARTTIFPSLAPHKKNTIRSRNRK